MIFPRAADGLFMWRSGRGGDHGRNFLWLLGRRYSRTYDSPAAARHECPTLDLANALRPKISLADIGLIPIQPRVMLLLVVSWVRIRVVSFRHKTAHGCSTWSALHALLCERLVNQAVCTFQRVRVSSQSRSNSSSALCSHGERLQPFIAVCPRNMNFRKSHFGTSSNRPLTTSDTHLM